jgi:hypothetical protein
VQSLAYSGAGFRGYYVDQTAYLDNLLKTDNLEHSPGLMWVFGSPEYENWIQQKQGLALLVCGGSQVVERAAQHIVKKLESTHLVLHFFYNSAIAAKPNSTSRNSKCDWGDLSCVWTLLMQVIDGYPPPQQQYLLRIFFARALDYIEYDEQVKILSNKPEEVFERLLGVSLQLDLWDALIHVLQMLLELPKWRDLETPWKERNIALILALDHMPDEDFASLFAVIRPTVYHLGQIFAAVNVLVTYPPKMGARIQLDGFGVLLEYDTERQGLRLPDR